MIRYLKEEKLEELLKEGTHIVDFYADWCGPCKMLGSVLEELENVSVIKVNTDEHAELATSYGVMSIPNVYIFKDGKEINHFVGYKTKEELLELLNES